VIDIEEGLARMRQEIIRLRQENARLVEESVRLQLIIQHGMDTTTTTTQ
jgi:hypothetical protein